MGSHVESGKLFLNQAVFYLFFFQSPVFQPSKLEGNTVQQKSKHDVIPNNKHTLIHSLCAVNVKMCLTWLDEFSITPTPGGRVDIFAQGFSKTGPKGEIKTENCIQWLTSIYKLVV